MQVKKILGFYFILLLMTLLFCACHTISTSHESLINESSPSISEGSAMNQPATNNTSFPESPFFTPIDYGHGVIGFKDSYDDQFYLIQGTDRAILLDTGMGMGNLKDYIDQICILPYYVVLTHGHYDHAGGSFVFDEAYMSYDDLSILADQCGTSAQYTVQNEPQIFNTCFHPLSDGQTFDLGDRTLQVITVPGHTPGSVVLLDKENRMLFAGDTANNQTLLMFDYCPSVETYRESLLKLKAVESSYDTFFTCHPDYVIDKKCVPNLIAICDDILAGTATMYPHDFQGIPGVVARKYIDGTCSREDGETGNLVYNPDKIHKSDE